MYFSVYEFLCGLYKDVRLPIYQRTFYIASQTPPFMPYVGDIFAKLLDKVPAYEMRKRSAPSLSMCFNMNGICEESALKHKQHTHIFVGPSQCSCSSKFMEESINNKFFMKFLSLFSSNKKNKECGTESFYKENKLNAQNNLLPIINTDISHFNGRDNCYHSLDKSGHNGVSNGLWSCEEFLEKSQLGAMHYNFHVNDLARDYLLKARYCEEIQNFKRSLALEPSNNSCNMRGNKAKNI